MKERGGASGRERERERERPPSVLPCLLLGTRYINPGILVLCMATRPLLNKVSNHPIHFKYSLYILSVTKFKLCTK